MHLSRKFAATAATLALTAVAGFAGVTSPAVASDTSGAFTQAAKDAMLAVLDAETPAQLEAAAANDALPEGIAEGATLVAETVPAGTDLTEESTVHQLVDIKAIAKSAVLRAIDPTLYQCEPTELSAFTNAAILGPLAGVDPAELSPEELQAHLQRAFAIVFYVSLGGADAPTYDLILNSNDPRFSRFGTDGINETADLQRTFFELKNFWDINGKSIRFEPLKATIIGSTKAGDYARYGKGAMASLAPTRSRRPTPPSRLRSTPPGRTAWSRCERTCRGSTPPTRSSPSTPSPSTRPGRTRPWASSASSSPTVTDSWPRSASSAFWRPARPR